MVKVYKRKFSDNFNFQKKFSFVDNPRDFQRKIETFLNMLDLVIQARNNEEIEDQYFDDENETINQTGAALRIRRKKSDFSKRTVTLKSETHKSQEKGLCRNEKERSCDEKEIKELISNVNSFNQLFPESGILLTTPLKNELIVNNKRQSIEFLSGDNKWYIHYDQFYFFSVDKGSCSPVFSEVEIEADNYSDLKDPKIAHLIDAFTSVLNLKEHQLSKAMFGKKFYAGGYPPVTNVLTIGLDLIGYSKLPPPIQLNSIQKLNQFVKEAISELLKKKIEPVYLPTGDGMYIVLEEEDIHISLKFIAQVQKHTREYIKSSTDKNLKFRTSIHAGPVFRYSDINENLNYAGNGINIAARVLGFGDAWHILASSEARELLITHGASENLFHDLGQQTVKHGASIHIFNIFESEKLGNPIQVI